MLLGRQDPPNQNGIMTMMEWADATYARCSEITAVLQAAEADGRVARGSNLYKFRTGPLRTFMETCSKTIELGSRRVTKAKLDWEMKDG